MYARLGTDGQVYGIVDTDEDGDCGVYGPHGSCRDALDGVRVRLPPWLHDRLENKLP